MHTPSFIKFNSIQNIYLFFFGTCQNNMLRITAANFNLFFINDTINIKKYRNFTVTHSLWSTSIETQKIRVVFTEIVNWLHYSVLIVV